jgi:Icc-related predicted phosphoesterase
MEETKKTRIAAVADIHVKETDKGKWINYFKEVSKQADVLLICGDLTDTGDEVEAQVLAEELKACTIPVVSVLVVVLTTSCFQCLAKGL